MCSAKEAVLLLVDFIMTLLNLRQNFLPGTDLQIQAALTSFSAGTGKKISHKTACHKKSFITQSKLMIF